MIHSVLRSKGLWMLKAVTLATQTVAIRQGMKAAGDDLLAAAAFDVSLANGGGFYSKKIEQPKLEDGGPLGQLVSEYS